MNIILVGGKFDNEGGKPSGLVSKLGEALKATYYNGGHYEDLKFIYEHMLEPADVIMWMPDVPNTLPKIRDIKGKFPMSMLVTSKRNFGEYEFQDLLQRSLAAKANLTVEFVKEGDKFAGRLFDPLGSVWCDFTTDVAELATAMLVRLANLRSFTRQGTRPDACMEPDFLQLIKDYAGEFHQLIKPAKEVTRYLGNSSFRCQRGFPSFRNNGTVYVSRRNVDKDHISADDFVPTWFDNDRNIRYHGKAKPSVDTPVQLRLYEMLTHINYMLHAHVYIKNGVFTENAVPCGAVEEVDEILYAIGNKRFDDYIAVNLKGHGCIIMAKNLDYLHGLQFYSRPVPEVM